MFYDREHVAYVITYKNIYLETKSVVYHLVQYCYNLKSFPQYAT